MSSTSGTADESFGDKVKRMANNCGHATGLCCFKMGKQTQITVLEQKVVARQKKFGVDYLNLIDQNASQQALNQCLREAQKDISKLQDQIDEHENVIDEKQAVAEEKIITATGASLASSGGSPRPGGGDGGGSVNSSGLRPRPSNSVAASSSSDSPVSSPMKAKKQSAKPSAASASPKANKQQGKKLSNGKGGGGGSKKKFGKPAAAASSSTPAGFAAAEIPEEYQGADPSRWKMTEQKFGGATSFTTLGRKEPIIGTTIAQGKTIFAANPEKYVAMIYQTEVATWPQAQQQFTLIHRSGTEGYAPTGISKNGSMTILTHDYHRLPRLKDNILPAQHCDKYTDSMTHQGRKLHSKKNKPALPGRGMGVGDCPNLKIIGDVDPADIYQGTVGDCWLLSGISALAEFDGAVKKLFRKTTKLDQRPLDSPNQYIITLWDLATWKEVDIVIDERLPVMANGSGQLLASRPSEDGELWVCYLEKALAAHCGGWDKVTGGQCTHAWALLTGCKEQYTISKNPRTGKFICCAKYNPNAKKWAKHANCPHDSDPSMWQVDWPKVGGGGSRNLELTEEQLFLKMVAWDETNYIVGAGTSGTSDKNSTDGLVDNHAYSVIESRSNVCGTGIDLLKVRNPWGRGEIEDGEFDDDGPGWDKYPQIKKELNPIVADDGIFWVTRQEFFQYYQTVYLSASDMTEFLED
mmetsp:Transcript_43540/g.105553  ORF Transcript_43540/g.105553 Transcript_43540/m.105553 type:complete len:694 (-) Transcript_43540:44-2125(-)